MKGKILFFLDEFVEKLEILCDGNESMILLIGSFYVGNKMLRFNFVLGKIVIVLN